MAQKGLKPESPPVVAWAGGIGVAHICATTYLLWNVKTCFWCLSLLLPLPPITCNWQKIW
jgi:hypothetical protein